MSAGGCCAEVYSCVFDYNTPRIALIKSRKVGLLNRLIQLLILAYVIGWVFVWEKGYQEFDTVVSSVTSKVKGVAATNTSDLGFRIWDVADYIIPAQLPDTSTICNSHRNCTPGYVGTHSNGVQTGRCVPYNESVKTCEVNAWCPVENDITVPMPAFLGAAENFTVLIKNNIWYPKFNFSKRNILQNISAAYLKTCMYDRVKHPFCPIFHLGNMVAEAGESFQEMAVLGGVMGIQISWNCDLDRKHTNCVPKYSFRRLDNRELDHNVSPGYNFRFAKYYKDSNHVESRTLMKIYGIRFDILVFGTAGKFDIIPTMINIGSGVALLGVATVLCDIVIFHFFKKRHYYREKKYKHVEDYEELVEERPHIWDPADQQYSDRNKRAESWLNIVTILYPDWDLASANEQRDIIRDVKNRWRSVKDRFKKFVSKHEKSGSSPPTKKCAYYENLLFLQTSRELRETHGNLSSPPSDADANEQTEESHQSTASVCSAAGPSGGPTPSPQSQESVRRARRRAASVAQPRGARAGRSGRQHGQDLAVEAINILRNVQSNDQWDNVGNMVASRLRQLQQDRQWPAVSLIVGMLDLWAAATNIPETVETLLHMKHFLRQHGMLQPPSQITYHHPPPSATFQQTFAHPAPTHTYPNPTTPQAVIHPPPHSFQRHLSPPTHHLSTSYMHSSLFPGSPPPHSYPDPSQDPRPL